MQMQPMSDCQIWLGSPAKIEVLDTDARLRVESPRAGGAYEISVLARDAIERLDDATRARLTTWLVDQRLLGVHLPAVRHEIVEYAKTKRPLYPWERAERLLRFIVSQMETIVSHPKVDSETLEALAWTESLQWSEVLLLRDYLFDSGWICDPAPSSSNRVQVTMEGLRHVSEQRDAVVSSQGFVAMWFDDSMNEAYENGIAPGIAVAGYEPLVINRKPDVDKIDDEIIAEIRRSRFLVADVTHDDQGARGGVYFEAGFAMGLGIPVIFACRKDMVDNHKLHFDTRQYAHIVWETPEELRDGLKNRILARIGEGPGIGQMV